MTPKRCTPSASALSGWSGRGDPHRHRSRRGRRLCRHHPRLRDAAKAAIAARHCETAHGRVMGAVYNGFRSLAPALPRFKASVVAIGTSLRAPVRGPREQCQINAITLIFGPRSQAARQNCSLVPPHCYTDLVRNHRMRSTRVDLSRRFDMHPALTPRL